MEHVWNILNYLITGYILSTLLFIACCEYIQTFQTIRPVYLMAANKVGSGTTLLKVAYMIWLIPQHYNTHYFFFSYPPVAAPMILFPCIISLIVFFGRRSPDGLSFRLLIICLIMTRIVEYVLTWFLANIGIDRAAERLSKVPYAEVIITTMLFFAACYFYARHKIDSTPSA